jgi:tetratricopeptide (TPR) repeat protein
MGVAYDSLDRRPEAVECYRMAVALSPRYAAAYYNMGVAYLRAGERGEALKQYASLKTFAPELAADLFRLLHRDQVIAATHK